MWKVSDLLCLAAAVSAPSTATAQEVDAARDLVHELHMIGEKMESLSDF